MLQFVYLHGERLFFLPQLVTTSSPPNAVCRLINEPHNTIAVMAALQGCQITLLNGDLQAF